MSEPSARKQPATHAQPAKNAMGEPSDAGRRDATVAHV